MGVYRTLKITRSDAKKAIIQKLEEVSDRELGDLLNVLLENSLYNAMIVNDDSENDGQPFTN